MNDNVRISRGHIELVLGNIVDQAVDAIVNAANTKLAGGGGVDGAIHRAAGPSLKEECSKFTIDERGQRCPTGEVRVSGAGNLPAKYVIHAVGPFYNVAYADKARGQLRHVYDRALEEAAVGGCLSISFPAISTGAYRFPFAEAADIALSAAAEHLRGQSQVQLIRFVLFKPTHLDVFREAMSRLV